MKLRKSFLLIILSLIMGSMLFTGCGIKVQRYHASADNVNTLKRLNTKINVKHFTANKSEYKVLCRLANDVTTPNKEPFEKYIEDAFIEELKMAGMYSSAAKITISGHLNTMNVSSGMTDAHWTLNMKVASSNGKSFTIQHTHKYSASFLGGIACQEDMPDAFEPTVQELIAKIIRDPRFKGLIR